MGGFDDAKKRFPNKEEMDTITGLYKEAVKAGAAGWSASVWCPRAGCLCSATMMARR